MRSEKLETRWRLLRGLKEAAAYTDLNQRHIRRLVDRGEIPHLRVGRLLFFDPDRLDRWRKTLER
jgi:excisionase family DNA binding protein